MTNKPVEVINLNPVFLENDSEQLYNFNSVFLYIFLFFQFIIICYLLYYFFKIELIFLYHYLIYGVSYTEEEKAKYTQVMNGIKNIITKNEYCRLSGSNWIPSFDNDKSMLTLDRKEITFKTEEECKSFLNQIS